MKFFFDCNLPLPIARAIGHLERNHTVIHQLDDGRFEQDSDDVHIITTLSHESPKPVWLTHDVSQRKIPAERAALRASGMNIFFWRRRSLTPHQQALKMVSVWPAIVQSALTAKVPTAFEIPCGPIGARLNDKIERICNTSELFG